MIGFDYCVQSHELTPGVELQHQVGNMCSLRAKFQEMAITPTKLVLSKNFKLELNRVGVSLDLRGKMVYHTRSQALSANIEMNELKPTWLLATLAVGSLLWKRSIHSSKKLTVVSDKARGKVDVSLRREDHGLSVVLNKLNLRLTL